MLRRTILGLLCSAAGVMAGSGPRVIETVTVYHEARRYAGWPANHGIWHWGNEILVGFEAGQFKVNPTIHAIDYSQKEDQLLARSLDGGKTWTIEQPSSLLPPPGGKMAGVPTADGGKPAVDNTEPIDFTKPGFALTARMTDIHVGPSRFYYSYDKGKTWRGPFRIPDFGSKGIAARTDYIVDGPRRCTIFLTAAKEDGREGRVLCARTEDGGITWRRIGWISSPGENAHSIMPSSLRLSKSTLISAIRRREGGQYFIELFRSEDDGSTWMRISTVTPRATSNSGNPPSMLRLADGRICVTYGFREPPYGIRARLSSDEGRTWQDEFILRDDGGDRDLGYTRTVQRPDGKLVTVYYFNEGAEHERYIAATIWDPGSVAK